MNKDEKKMIEEMIEIIHREQINCIKNGCKECEYYGYVHCVSSRKAEALYNAGYRKVGDDEIVIKQTDYVELNKDFYDWKKEYDHNCLLRLEVFELEKQLEKAKQETREILQEVVNAWNTGNLNQRELAYICTKYGIELEG